MSAQDTCATSLLKSYAEARLAMLRQHLKRRDRMGAISSGVTEFEYSKRQERLDINTMVIPIHIRGLLAEFGKSSAFILLSGEYDA